MEHMQLTITQVDHAPSELHEQIPLVVKLVREIPGEDRPDYWLGEAKSPIRWIDDNHETEVTHVIVAARWEGTRIEAGVKNLPVGIAYVTDQSLIGDSSLDFSKCAYVAIGIAHETGRDRHAEKLRDTILPGTIGRFFGKGGS